MVRTIHDSIELNQLAQYNMDMASLVFYMDINQWHYGRYVNKGNDNVVVEKNIIVPSKNVPKKVILDETMTVRLGGTFEKIGDEDESVGGDNQKVGSADK